MDKDIDLAINAIHKEFGKSSLMAMDEFDGEYETFSTGSLLIDEALGGGIARGRIVEVYGHESSGKTTLCLSTIAEAQKEGHRVFFIDAEHAFDPSWAEINGVNLDPSLFRMAQPSSGEEALNIVQHLVTAGAALVVVDSVAAMVPKRELEGNIGDAHVGLQARLMSQAMRLLVGACSETNSTIMFVNQTRDKVGVTFGSPTTTPGGKALKFAASQRLDIARIKQVKEGKDTVIGQHVQVRVVKNKIAPPFRVAKTDLLFDCGLSQESEIIDLAVIAGIIKQNKAWFSYNDQNIGQGKEKTRQYLIDNPEFKEEILAKLRGKDEAK